MPLQHAILGFLEYRPMTGYDLKKNFDQSIVHFWSATQSHIYKALQKLNKEGFVTATLIPQEGRPNRKQYQITVTGQAELRRWLTSPLPLGQVREDWLIQIFFSYTSTNDEIASLLKARMEEMRERVTVYRTIGQAAVERNAPAQADDASRQLWQITLDYGVDYYTFQLAWLEKTLTRVQDTYRTMNEVRE